VKRALITGITGQDGSHLADLLLSEGYEVHGIVRRSSSFNTARIDHIFDRLILHHGDLLDGGSLRRIVAESRPDEVYHLGAQSHVRVSFDEPEYTADVVAGGTLRLLEAVRLWANVTSAEPRIYHASSSEMFGGSPSPQNENTPFHPRSPYAIAKVAAHNYAQLYRDAYKLYVSCGILFNHEGPRRGETFVTRKITRAAARIKLGLQKELRLGNLDARRDWGLASEYVEAMWRMLQLRHPDDFVIATGSSNTVRTFLHLAFEHLGLDWVKYVTIDSRYVRPAEVDDLCGDASKARSVIGWEPRTTLDRLVCEMVDHDLGLALEELG
jgi:GDPmannose 4,6-dehydratase